MSTSFRTMFAVLMIGGALVAAAAAPTSASGRAAATTDYVGTWVTWYETAQGAMSPCARLYVVSESDSSLDGMWSVPGWNGLVRGTVRQGRAGLVWQGDWRGADAAGSFQFALEGPGIPEDQFKGTYIAAGDARTRYWNGAREVDGHTPEVPCAWTR
ncbi:MAG TPA: hypothetical protein VFT45_03200 [Longimicrobium sp.]|nr:hypothetical protein [Longimicrobium sp.]